MEGQEGLIIEYRPADDLAGPATVTVSLGGVPIAAESIDLNDADAREAFAAKVCDGRPGIDGADLRTKLLQLAAELAGKVGFSPEAIAVETRLDSVLQAGGPVGVYKDSELLEALAKLAVQEPAAYSAIRVRLRDGGVKMRDFDRAMKQQIEQAVREQPPEIARDEKGGFFVSDGNICRTKLTPFAPVTVPLCNFTATITDEVTRDDGQERRVVFGITGKLATGKALPRTEVSADAFQDVVRWVVRSWGSDAIVWANEARALPSAIQALSQTDKERRTVFTYTGWREFDGNIWAYLHAGGAIGLPPGWPAVSVDLQPPLTRFALPDPVTGDEAKAAIRASLQMLDLADRRLTVPVYAAIWRAPLGGVDFALHPAGPTGAFKSELAALAQQHYGAEMNARHLPGSWSSTANALEAAAFHAKDTLFVVDDFAPNGGHADIGRLNQTAERLFRAQGNNAGRQRMNAGGELRQAKPPRGLILSTGEEIPRGQSLRARLLILEIGPGDIDRNRLTECQRNAERGLYSRAMATYLHWLAPKYGDWREVMPSGVAKFRAEATAEGMHARTPGIVANLAFGLRLFLRFAQDIGAITATERARLRSESWTALLAAADSQAARQAVAEPAQHFLRLLAAILAAQRAHVASIDGDYPDTPARWGWRKHTTGTVFEWRPEGRRIGWTDGAHLYLEPEESYSQTARLAVEQNEPFGITAATLRRRLAERGLLLSTDENRDTLLVRKTVEGVRRNVLHLSAGVFDDEQPDHREPTTRNPVNNAEKQELVGLVGLQNTPCGDSQTNFDGRETGEF